MLVLTRKSGSGVLIGRTRLYLSVLPSGEVRVAIEAPEGEREIIERIDCSGVMERKPKTDKVVM